MTRIGFPNPRHPCNPRLIQIRWAFELRRIFLEGFMLAKEFMTRAVECISPDSPIHALARQMKSLDIGFLPICENDRLIGTVTDRDIVLRILAEEKDPRKCTARDVMTTDVHWCFEDQTAEDVSHYMA